MAKVSGCTPEQAKQMLVAADNNVRLAIVMTKLGLDVSTAQARLTQARDNLSEALQKV